MVTNAEKEEVETTRDRAEGLVRSAIAGHPQGAVRRIILYVILGVALVAEFMLGGVPAVAGALCGAGVATLILLAMTDQLA